MISARGSKRRRALLPSSGKESLTEEERKDLGNLPCVKGKYRTTTALQKVKEKTIKL